MARATFVVELDLDHDGTYGTVLGTDVKSATIFRGRDSFMDSAREGRLSVTLNNSLGKYSPRGPSVVTENGVALTTLVPIRVRTTDPVTAPHFTGIITSISVDPHPNQQEVTLEATDSMIVLQRAIISQRLMQNKPTGIIINRLIDAAEGELVSNPAFDEDLSGYSVISGGGTSRLTSGEILEGQAVMRVTAPAASDGVRYTFPPVATNLCANGGFETNTAGWSALDGATLSRTTTQNKFGSASGQAATPAGYPARVQTGVVGAINTQYTVSAWVMCLTNETVNAKLTDFIDTDLTADTPFALTAGVWRRIALTGTTDGLHGTFYGYLAINSGATFYIDGVQIETGSVATPYIETDGAPASGGSQMDKTIGAAIYVINDISAAGSVALKVNQNSGGALGSAVLALAGYWQRLPHVASGPFSGGTQYLDIQAIGGGGTFRVGALHAVESKVVIPRNIDLGNTYLPYYGPFRVISMGAIDEVRDNELGGLFYMNGGGTARFEQRAARWVSTAPLGTINETFWKMDYTDDSEDRISKISFSYGNPESGAPATYIWELELPTSRLIPANSIGTIWADYGYWAKDVTKPVANTDYRLNRSPGGDDIDMSDAAYGTFTWIPYGMGAKFLFSTAGTSPYLTQLAVRATPIRESSDLPLVEHVPANPPPMASELEHDYPLNNNKPAVQSWAEFLGSHFDGQRESLSITLRPRTVSILQQMLTREVSDIVSLTNNSKLCSTGINGNYYIENIRHSIKSGGFLHETTWALTKVQDEVFAIWDSSSWDSSHVWAP